MISVNVFLKVPRPTLMLKKKTLFRWSNFIKMVLHNFGFKDHIFGDIAEISSPKNKVLLTILLQITVAFALSSPQFFSGNIIIYSNIKRLQRRYGRSFRIILILRIKKIFFNYWNYSIDLTCLTALMLILSRKNYQITIALWLPLTLFLPHRIT